MSEKRKIAFFQDKFNVGGIQRSLLNLLRNLDYDRYEVHLYLFSDEDFFDDDLPEGLIIKYLKPLSRIYSFLPFRFAMKAVKPDLPESEAYDAAIDFNSYQVSCAAWALRIPAKKHISWIHNDVGIKLADEWKYRVLWNAFKGKFKYFDAYAAVSEGLIAPFKEASGVSDREFAVINNYIDELDIIKKAKEEPDPISSVDGECFNLVAMGHLNHQKGYDIMLDIFARACSKRDDLRLYILGDGDERPKLEELVSSLSLEGKVFMPGYSKNPFAVMELMDAFISTSRYEGQPLNLMEALAIGLPIYCTENLEKYCPYVKGSSDLAAALVSAEREEKKPMSLKEYNSALSEAFDRLISK